MGLVAILLNRPDMQHYLDEHTAIAFLVVFGGAIPLVVWQFATGARRLHDINLSGWLSLLLIVPGMQLFLLFMPGTKGPNKYGSSPTQHIDLTALLHDPNSSSDRSR
jgi:uncharacterized membrane protein YhaH (DUF805 family)